MCKMHLLVIGFLSAAVSVAQEIRFADPQPLSNEINSEGEEVNPILSQDGKKLYFSRAFFDGNTGGKPAGIDIWVSQVLALGKYARPVNEKVWNNKLNNSVVGVSRGNQKVFLINAYSNRPGIAFSVSSNGVWSRPKIEPIPGIQLSKFVGFYMHPSERILIISAENSNSFGKEDLYVSLKDSLGRWSDPVNLGNTVNTEGYEISPFLSEDGKRLYFASDGHKGYGDADIYVTERLYNNWAVWTRPKNLGSKINSEKFDAYFSMYGDSICYFASNRASALSDIFECKVTTVKKRLLSDSVNRIVDETKKLLNELRANEEPDVFEYVASPLNSVILSNPMQQQFKKMMTQIDLTKIKTIELTCYRLHPDQLNNVLEFLVKNGLPKSKIGKQTQVNSGTSQSGVEFKVFYSR
jgi:hypothetical protein